MRLEIDLGNTLLKWRLIGQVRLSGGRIGLAELEKWLSGQTLPAEQIWISSVASDAVNHQLSLRLQSHFGVEPVFARTTRESAGLFNAYSQPEKMGVDRWLAMLAAWDKFKSALIVVDAGSAITIERISADGHYIGGTILAGFNMQQTTLLGQTARVRFEAVQGDALSGGVDTASCVASGAEFVIRGVAVQLKELLSQYEGARLVITGGDAEQLIGYLDKQLDYVAIPELVMDGLSLAKREKV